MKKILIIFTLSFSLLNCGESPASKKGSGDKMFKTTAPSQLYFNNIRSINYSLEEVGENKMKVYRSRKFDMETRQPVIFPLIVLNWLADEAYLFIEKSKFESFGEPLTLRMADKTDQLLILENAQPKAQHTFLLQLLEWIKNKASIEVKTVDGEFVKIFDEFGDRSNFVLVVNDYLRLTEAR